MQSTLSAFWPVSRSNRRGGAADAPGEDTSNPKGAAPTERPCKRTRLTSLRFEPSLCEARKPASAPRCTQPSPHEQLSTGTPDAPPTYTPLEQQILALKAAHPGVLLLVEVGYKMKFYGDDARIASQLLNIACFREKNLLAAMIPVPRLAVHVKRLVAAGHKVGVCRQTETRALKAATDSAHKPFSRELTALYTAATWIDNVDVRGSDAAAEQVMVAVVELRGEVGLVAVDVATANVTYDAFADDALCTALETRLAHLEPREIVLASSLAPRAARVLRVYAAAHAARVERPETPAPALDALLDGAVLAHALALPRPVQVALAYLAAHLATFRLTSALEELANYETFVNRTSMLLSGAALRHLELLHNGTDGGVYGSVLGLVDHCRTPMGRRVLRQWLRRPLLDARRIAERADAVDILRERRAHVLHQAVELLTRLPDLARGVARIAYGLVEPPELLTILLALHRVTHEFHFTSPEAVGTGSALLDGALFDLGAARDAVAAAIAAMDVAATRRGEKADMYKDPERFPRIQEVKDMLVDDEAALIEHLAEVRAVLRRPSLQYTSVSGIENLVEVRAAQVDSTPADWVRVSATKQVVRFHTPTIVRLSRQREQHRELLADAACDAFRSFVKDVAGAYELLRRVVQALALLDALLSLAELAARPGYVRPVVHAPGNAPSDALALRGFRHPVTEALCDAYVPNDIVLGGSDAPRAVLLTGSNMGGKSSAVRAIALVVVLAQMGAFVPCIAAELTCHDSIATRMGAADDLVRGKSTFMLEADETAHILRTTTPRSLVILDEFGRGTSTFDGVALAYAVLHHFLARGDAAPKLLFISHYLSLGALAKQFPQRLAPMHMGVRLKGEQHLVFLHRLERGLAQHSLGIHIGMLAGLPPEVVDTARDLATALQQRDERQARARLVRALGRRDMAAALVLLRDTR